MCVPPPQADAGTFVVRRVCRAPARVFDTPGGVVIAILGRGQRVRVIRRAAGRKHWVCIRAALGISGWMSDRAFCR
jgi:hypothetical protein